MIQMLQTNFAAGVISQPKRPVDTDDYRIIGLLTTKLKPSESERL